MKDINSILIMSSPQSYLSECDEVIPSEVVTTTGTDLLQISSIHDTNLDHSSAINIMDWAEYLIQLTLSKEEISKEETSKEESVLSSLTAKTSSESLETVPVVTTETISATVPSDENSTKNTQQGMQLYNHSTFEIQNKNSSQRYPQSSTNPTSSKNNNSSKHELIQNQEKENNLMFEFDDKVTIYPVSFTSINQGVDKDVRSDRHIQSKSSSLPSFTTNNSLNTPILELPPDVKNDPTADVFIRGLADNRFSRMQSGCCLASDTDLSLTLPVVDSRNDSQIVFVTEYDMNICLSPPDVAAEEVVSLETSFTNDRSHDNQSDQSFMPEPKNELRKGVSCCSATDYLYDPDTSAYLSEVSSQELSHDALLYQKVAPRTNIASYVNDVLLSGSKTVKNNSDQHILSDVSLSETWSADNTSQTTDDTERETDASHSYRSMLLSCDPAEDTFLDYLNEVPDNFEYSSSMTSHQFLQEQSAIPDSASNSFQQTTSGNAKQTSKLLSMKNDIIHFRNCANRIDTDDKIQITDKPTKTIVKDSLRGGLNKLSQHHSSGQTDNSLMKHSKNRPTSLLVTSTAASIPSIVTPTAVSMPSFVTSTAAYIPSLAPQYEFCLQSPYLHHTSSGMSSDALLSPGDAFTSFLASFSLKSPEASQRNIYLSMITPDTSDNSTMESEATRSSTPTDSRTEGEGSQPQTTSNSLKATLRSRLHSKRQVSEKVSVQDLKSSKSDQSTSSFHATWCSSDLMGTSNSTINNESKQDSESRWCSPSTVSQDGSTSDDSFDIYDDNEEKAAAPSAKKKRRRTKRKDEQDDDDEEETQIAKREKNRLAAQKCRQRKSDKIDMLYQQIKRLEDKQEGIRAEVDKLDMEREQLQEMLRLHSFVCQNKSI